MNAPTTNIPEDAALRPPGRIITFYSYKGGTGRSMALANVAWILASNGRRVLVIDWDLEAPGLHRYFGPFLSDPEMADAPGLIDYFVHFVEAARLQASQPAPTKSEVPWFRDQADLMRYSVALNYDFPDGGVLDFVSAGQQGPSYGARVNTFQWNEFYEKLGGGVFLEAMKEQLRDQYDYILIDSRTGLSDTSGICTVQMPDDLVVCFTFNRQSIQGAAATAHSADQQRRRADGTQGLRIWPVPTRVELHEKDRLEAARLKAREKFAPFLWHIPAARRPDYWGSAEILYFPYYAYEEVLATIADTPRTTASLLNSMERLTGHLTEQKVVAMMPMTNTERALLLAKYQPILPQTAVPKRAPRFFISYAKADNSVHVVRDLAKEIVNQFGADSVFFDEKMRFGAPRHETFQEELTKADALIIVAGPNWMVNTGSKIELEWALKLQKPVIPLLVDTASWGQLPPELSERHGMELRPGNESADLRVFASQLTEGFSATPSLESALPLNVDDPQKGQWGGRSEDRGRHLTAQVREVSTDWFQVTLRLETLERPALEGDVEFHLHPSFQPSKVRVTAVDGRAELTLLAWGAFTVGVSAEGERTRLELDLAQLSDAPRVFRER